VTILSGAQRGVRAAAGRLGLDVTRISSKPFGQDVWLDLERLSHARGSPLRTVFDVGANVGETAVSARARFPDARILAFEPHPQTYRRLCSEVVADRIETFNFAFGEERRVADLFEYRFSTLNSLVENAPYAVRFGETGRNVPVEVRTIDDFCAAAGIDSIDLLKIDTEGYDLRVLRGAATMLAGHCVSFVYAEFNDLFEHPGATGGALLPISELLYRAQFQLIATYTDQVILEGDPFVVSNALFAHRPTAVRIRLRPPHVEERRARLRSQRRPRRLVRQQARFLAPPLVGIAAFAAVAVLAETFTDRDWSLSGLEWPADFVTSVLLVCLVSFGFGLVRLIVDMARNRSTTAENS
jgi:FkbM family methyltransferase